MTQTVPVGRRCRVRTCATSANLGPGFDALGISLDWYDEAEAEITDGGVDVSVTGQGEGDLPTDGRHLVVSTLLDGLSRLGLSVPGIRFKSHNTIPLARGLGSSSAAITAGLGLAWGLAYPNVALDRDWVFDVAVNIEGHPDNVAPAVYGGFNIGWQTPGGVWRAVPSPVHDDIVATALVPEQVLETTSARAAMPGNIPFSDAVENSAHAALLVHALQHSPELLLPATEDRLHQQYRADLYPRSLALVQDLRDEGLAACISGAGPTILVLHSRSQSALVDVTLEQVSARNPASVGFAAHRHNIGNGLQIIG